MREEFLPFALPDLDETDLAQIEEVLESGWLTTGPKTAQFEAAFAEAVGANEAIAVNSCTAAMHLALEAIGLKAGDEVITTPYTFAATAEVIRYFDARPILVDIRPEEFNIDPELVEVAISERTRAILPVHVGGLPAEMEAIRAIAREYHLAIVEDAAHAFPAKYKDIPIGYSLAADADIPAHFTCFSFYATKNITTGEGGMICTRDKALAERCRMMALHGISKDAWKRYTAEGSWHYEIVAPGYKYNMTDIAASLGLAQLAKAERMRQRREAIARQYSIAFSELDALQIPFERQDCQHAWHLYMLRLNLDQLTIDRAQFIKELRERSIGASVHFIPLHLHRYYRQTYGYQPEDLPVAFQEYLRQVSLPLYSRMTEQDVMDVIEAVQDIVTCFGR